jgi:glutaredoxin
LEIVFYSTGCPKCKVLKSKLDSKNIEYKTVTDTDEMIKLGMTIVPFLTIDGEIKDFKESVDYINSLE